MSAKKFDLAKTLGMKIAGRMNAGGVPDRFAQAAADSTDKREQRRRDAAAGLVPFACKLPGELTHELQQRATAHEGGMNGLVAELLGQALNGKSPVAKAKTDDGEPPAAPKAKKEAAPKAAATPAKAPAAKEPAAKKTAAKKTPVK
jgi:hypothetical protein